MFEYSWAKGLTMKPNQKTPDLSEVIEALDQVNFDYSHTPDAIQLEKREYQPVFIYCNLSKGRSEHGVVENICLETDQYGRSHTPYIFTEDRFELWMSNANKYPVALRTNASAATRAVSQRTGIVQTARLKGRLYKIRSDCMNLLDFHKRNGIEFLREKVNVYIPYRIQNGCDLGLNRLSQEFIEDGKVWMYIGKKDYFDPLLDGGILFSPLDIKEPIPERAKYKQWEKNGKLIECGPYYFYNPKEIENST